MGSLLCQHHSLAHEALLHQARLDLAQFDAEPADLHLMVDTAEIVDNAIGAAAGQISGAVEASAVCIERVGHEAFCCQGGTCEIAWPDRPRRSAVHRRPRRHGFEFVIQDV